MKGKSILALGAVLLASLITSPPASTQDGTPTQTASTAECETQHALLMIDESGSLVRSDPDARRVEAAKLVVEALSPQSSGRAPVDLTIAGFGSSYTTYATLALPDGRDAALSEVEEFRGRSSHRNTDYVAALRAASAHFAGIDGPEQCKTLLWFTDGGHDVEFPGESQAAGYTRASDPMEITRQLESLVCGPLPGSAVLSVPVRDEILRAGFRTVISELRAGMPNARQQERLDLTYPVLNRLVRAPGDSCQIPGSWTTVSRPEELVSQLFGDAQVALGRQAVDCSMLTDGKLRSDVVRSVAFRIEGARAAQLRVGEKVESLTGSVFERDVTVVARPAGSQIQVSGGNVVDCYVELEAELRLLAEPVLFKGASETALDLVVTGPDFAEAHSLDPELAPVHVSVDGTPVETRFDAGRRVWTAYLPGTNAEALRLVAVATLANGSELARLETEVRVSDVPPAPTFAWAGADVLEGTGILKGAVRVTPLVTVESAEYCVSFPDGTVPVDSAVGATGVATLSVQDGEHCGAAAAGEPFEVPAEVQVDQDMNGTIALWVGVASTYRDPSGAELSVGDEGPVDIGRVALVRAPDRVREALIVAVLVAASCLFPLLLLWFFNARHGRLRDPSTLAALPLQVELDRAQNMHVASPGFVVKRPATHKVKLAEISAVNGSRRRWHLPGGFAVERRLPLNPFGSPSSMITAPRDHLVSSIAPTTSKGTVRAPVRFNECLLVDLPATAPTTGEPVAVGAVLVIEQGRTIPQIEECLSTLLQRCGPHIRLEDDQASREVPPLSAADGGPRSPQIGGPSDHAPTASPGPPPAPSRSTPSGAGSTPPPAPARGGGSRSAPPPAPVRSGGSSAAPPPAPGSSPKPPRRPPPPAPPR